MNLTTIRIIGLKIRDFAASDCSEAMVQECECLAGACAICARVMQLVLEELGHESTFVMGQNRHSGHCWNEMELHGSMYAIDLTATQFYCIDQQAEFPTHTCYADCPEVMIEPVSAYTSREFVRKFRSNIQTNENALDSIRRGWTRQSPTKYTGAIDEFVSQVVSQHR